MTTACCRKAAWRSAVIDVENLSLSIRKVRERRTVQRTAVRVMKSVMKVRDFVTA
jgi:hypothetical protein